jgi:Flp pilus assembly protein TadG
MTMNQMIAKLRAACRRFAGAREGNTLITFALAFIPLVGLTGAAVDYSRANSVQTAMQAAADTTALMIAQNAASITSTTLQSQATSYYGALFTRSDAANLSVTATYSTTGGSTVVVKATATYKTSFMGVVGFSSLPLAASSTASWGNSRLRVALVLDNTGSMSQSGKITALKTATQNLLTQLQNAATNNGDVYVSIIPFVKDVNLDSGNYSANWIYWDDAANSDNSSWDANNGSCSAGTWYRTRQSCYNSGGGSSCSISGYNTQSTCQNAGTCNLTSYTTQSTCQAAGGQCSISGNTSQSTCQNAGTCSISGKTSSSSCTSAHACSNTSYTSQTTCQNNHYTWAAGVWTPGAWTVATWTAGVWSGATWTPKAHSTWNGCVMDRGDPGGPNSGNYDTNTAATDTTNTATLYAAEQYSMCPQAAVGLSYDWASMSTEVTNMSPNGNTNQNIGLQVGWLSLVGGGPFTAPAMDPNYTYTQVIILLTDGLNTENRWSTSESTIDARQTLTCTNIKNAGIVLYTIQVNTDGSPTSTLLQNCASDSTKFFLLTSSSQIVTTFNTIGTNLSRLRIAK